MAFTLYSDAFSGGGSLPRKYTCDGEGVSPPLRWEDPPPGTRSFALVLEDPDHPGGTWVHWILYSIPAEAIDIPEAVPPTPILIDGSIHGINSWGNFEYGPPCPQSGRHRYFFRLYALDIDPEMNPGLTHEQVMESLIGHTIGRAALMATYSRSAVPQAG